MDLLITALVVIVIIYFIIQLHVSLWTILVVLAIAALVVYLLRFGTRRNI